MASLWCFQHFGVNQTAVKNIISPHISKRKKKKISDWKTKSSLIYSVQPSMMKSRTEWPCSCSTFHDKLFWGALNCQYGGVQRHLAAECHRDHLSSKRSDGARTVLNFKALFEYSYFLLLYTVEANLI